MAFIAARMSVLRGRPPGEASGISGSSRATLHPLDRPDSRCLPADKSDGAPSSTSLIIISPVAGESCHLARGHNLAGGRQDRAKELETEI